MEIKYLFLRRIYVMKRFKEYIVNACTKGTLMDSFIASFVLAGVFNWIFEIIQITINLIELKK